MPEREPLLQTPEEVAENAGYDRWFGAWAPLDPPRLAEFMAGFERPWWIVGGWSIEAFTGVLREHEDVDLSILACDVPALRAHVGDALEPVEHGRRHAAPAERHVPRGARRREPDLGAPVRARPVGHRPADHPGPRRAVDQQARPRPRRAARGGDLGGGRRHPLPAPRDHPALQGGAPPAQGRPRPRGHLAAAAARDGRPGCARPSSGSTRDTRGWSARDPYAGEAMPPDRLPRPRSDHADAAGGHRGDDGAPRRRSATPTRCTPPGGTRAGWSRSRARPSRRRSTAGPARWSSPPAAPSPTTSRSRASSGPAGPRTPAAPASCTTAVEHHAVLDPLHWLAEAEGVDVEFLPVDARGRPRRRRRCAPRSSATPSRSPWSR